VSEQEADAGSTLAFTREFLKARKASPALRLGEIAFLDVPAPLLAFTRSHGGERLLCLFNMSGAITVFQGEAGEPLPPGCGEVLRSAGRLDLAPYAAWFGRI
jgi:alpha-glucosidase